MEVFKSIEGYNNLYQVSDLGNVKNNKGKLLRFSRDKKGYSHVCLFMNGKRTYFLVHRLVAIVFVPNPENKSQVNHKDGDKAFNFKINLEWVTPKENSRHAYDELQCRRLRGEEINTSKLTETDVINIRLDSSTPAIELAKLYNVSEQTIHSVLTKKTWKHI